MTLDKDRSHHRRLQRHRRRHRPRTRRRRANADARRPAHRTAWRPSPPRSAQRRRRRLATRRARRDRPRGRARPSPMQRAQHVRPGRCDRQQCRRDAAVAHGLAEGRRVGPDGRREHQGRALRHRRRAAGDDGARLRPHRQHRLDRRARRLADRGRLLRHEISPCGRSPTACARRTSDIRVTCIHPGVVESELADTITDPAAAEAMKTYRAIALQPDAIARAVRFAHGAARGCRRQRDRRAPNRQHMRSMTMTMYNPDYARSPPRLLVAVAAAARHRRHDRGTRASAATR